MNPEITIAPLPHVAVQVFSETSQVVAVIEEASHDRRMAKAHLRIQAGGAAAPWKPIAMRHPECHHHRNRERQPRPARPAR